jgi:hypothetical protein
MNNNPLQNSLSENNSSLLPMTTGTPFMFLHPVEISWKISGLSNGMTDQWKTAGKLTGDITNVTNASAQSPEAFSCSKVFILMFICFYKIYFSSAVKL